MRDWLGLLWSVPAVLDAIKRFLGILFTAGSRKLRNVSEKFALTQSIQRAGMCSVG